MPRRLSRSDRTWDEGDLRAKIEELAAFPLPTFDTVVDSAFSGDKKITEFPDAELFVLPAQKYGCIGCDQPLIASLFGTFTWGITHGEGFCCICGWPGRGAHFVVVEGEPEKRCLGVVLQYSPDWILEIWRKNEKENG